MMPGARRAPRATGVLALLLLGTLAGCGSSDDTPAASSETAPSSPSAPQETYGGYPSFLPRNTLPGHYGQHQVVDASAHRPTLATQGDTVRVHVGSTTVLATVTGPAVPVAGQQYQAPASPATWQVDLRDASAALRLNASTFQAVDERGSVYRLRTQGHVPATLEPGRDVHFALFAPAFQVGEGRMRWIPVGHLAPVEWDFVVETD